MALARAGFTQRALGFTQRALGSAQRALGSAQRALGSAQRTSAPRLCDSVLPVCPYRQWTLSLPFALRYRLIRDSSLFTRVVRSLR